MNNSSFWNRIKKHVKLIYLILIIAFLLRFYGIFIYYPYDLHPDEASLVRMFMTMLVTGDLNPHFFYHPDLLIYLSALVNYIIVLGNFIPTLALVTYNESVTMLLTIDKIITVIFSTLTVYYVYKIGKLIWDESAGLLAATVLTFSIAHIVNSFYLIFDVPVTFFVVLTFYFFINLLKNPEKRSNYLKVGLGIGLAISTKYNALLLLPFYLIILIFFLKSVKFSFKNKELGIQTNNVIIKNFLLSLLITFIVFFAINPYILLSFDEFRADFFDYNMNQLSGTEGVVYNPNIQLWGYYLFNSLLPGFSIFGLILLIISIVLIKKDKYAVLFMLWIFLFYFINESFMYKAPRYILPLFPIACLIMGRVLATNKKLLLLMGGMIIITSIFIAQLYPETRIQAYDWVIENYNTSMIYACPYSIPWAGGCTESLYWVESSSHVYYLISSNVYDFYFKGTNGQDFEKYHFYKYIIDNGTLIKEFSVLFTFGQSCNPTVRLYYVE